MENLAPLFIGFGVVCALIGFVKLLIETFSAGAGWGLAYLLFHPTMIIFVVLHWRDSKNAFGLYAGGLAMMFYGMSLTAS